MVTPWIATPRESETVPRIDVLACPQRMDVVLAKQKHVRRKRQIRTRTSPFTSSPCRGDSLSLTPCSARHTTPNQWQGEVGILAFPLLIRDDLSQMRMTIRRLSMSVGFKRTTSDARIPLHSSPSKSRDLLPGGRIREIRELHWAAHRR